MLCVSWETGRRSRPSPECGISMTRASTVRTPRVMSATLPLNAIVQGGYFFSRPRARSESERWIHGPVYSLALFSAFALISQPALMPARRVGRASDFCSSSGRWYAPLVRDSPAGGTATLERCCMYLAFRTCLAACVFQPEGACWKILVLSAGFDAPCCADG
jgi:hypothetical protein